MLNDVTDKLEIEYPCTWLYKLIGRSEPELRGAVLEVIEGDSYTLEISNRSSGGKYVSLNVEVVVTDEAQRTRIFESLRSHRHVRMVL